MFNQFNKLALYCRAGFEKETAAEITEKAGALGIFGFTRLEENSGYVIFECYQPGEADHIAQQLTCKQLIFARQLLVVSDLITDLPAQDRITSLLNHLQEQIKSAVHFSPFSQVWVETADTNEAKELLTFCRKFSVPLRQALKRQRIIQESAAEIKQTSTTLHIFFTKPGCCYLGYSYNQAHHPFFMGIHRLKFPADAPSRSTLKLEEAIHHFFVKTATTRANE